MAKTAAIGIRIEPELKDAIEAAAKAERRSVASYIEKVIADDLEKRGLLTPAERSGR
ncbi:hypothetical protein ACC703_05835 [Rhizobium ruizarguesonis]|uniref:hypothetical protein n=1 Tax=Rhizobium sp. WYCCWR 11146 TaxID=2749833 RepID=UPI0003784578|nr:hypothetical protein [Rhizobium sp. WYCCWR 11146]MBA1346013.1 hypothetical protein [Rhizobium sp. WYCCWR 11146]QND13455.1 hypothetical protein HB775_05865 [Rhizobium leguminosarum bv. trifolii]